MSSRRQSDTDGPTATPPPPAPTYDRDAVLERIARLLEENHQEPIALLNDYVANGQKIIKCRDKAPMDRNWQNRPGLSAGAAWEWLQTGGQIGIQVQNRYCADVDNPQSLEFFYEQFNDLVESGAHIDKSKNGYHIWWRNRPDESNWRPGIKGSESVLPNGITITPRGHAMQIIMAPSPDREHVTPAWRLWSPLPVVPDHWVPTMSKKNWVKEQERERALSATKEPKEDTEKPKSKLAASRKLERIRNALAHACDRILAAQKGSRNSEHNEAAYTAAGLVAGALEAGLDIDEHGALLDIVAAAQLNMAEDPAKAERDIKVAWRAGLAKPIVCDLQTIGTKITEMKLATAQSLHRGEVPVPGPMTSVEEAAQLAVAQLQRKFDLFYYNEVIWYSEIGEQSYQPLCPAKDHEAARDLAPFYKAYIRWFDFAALRSVVWPANIEAAITVELLKTIPRVDYMGPPCVINDTWHDTDTATMKFVRHRIERPPAGTYPKESMVWLIDEIFTDFRFESPRDLHKAISSLFAPYLRHNAHGGLVPMVVWTAPEQGVGKTMLATLTGMIASDSHERDMMISTSIADDQELRKFLTSALLVGSQTIILDNIKTILGGPTIESILTSSSWSDRILGGNTVYQGRLLAQLHATLNRAAMSDDVCRRVIIVNQVKNTDIKTSAGLRHPNLIRWFRDHLPEIRGHLVNVIEGWLAEKAPRDQEQSVTSYIEHCSQLAGLAAYASIPVGDLVEERVNIQRYSNDATEQEAFLAFWLAQVYQDEEWTSPAACQRLQRALADNYMLEHNPVLQALNLAVLIREYDKMIALSEHKTLEQRFTQLVRRLVGKKYTLDGYRYHAERGRRTKFAQQYRIVIDETPPGETEIRPLQPPPSRTLELPLS